MAKQDQLRPAIEEAKVKMKKKVEERKAKGIEMEED